MNNINQYYKIKSLFTIALVCIAALLLCSCEKEVDPIPAPDPNNVIAILEKDPQLSSFLAVLDSAGFRPAFKVGGPYTLFAPNNAAVQAYFTSKGYPGGITQLWATTLTITAKRTFVNDMVRDQIVFKNFKADELPAQVFVPRGKTITVSKTGSDIFLNTNIKITRRDISASNAVVHEVDKVIIIP